MEHNSGAYFKKGKTLYTIIDGFINLYTPSVTLVCDTTNQVLVINKPIKFNQKTITMMDMDNISKTYKSVSFKEVGATNTYYIKIKKTIHSEIDSLIISFNKESYLMTSMELFFRNEVKLDPSQKYSEKSKIRLQVRFSNIKTQSVTKQIPIKLSQYVKKEKGTYVGIGSYANFEILDQRKK